MSQSGKVLPHWRKPETAPDDRAERHGFLPRLWLLFSPFHFTPKQKREEEKEMNSKNRDKKSCLSARSHLTRASCKRQF